MKEFILSSGSVLRLDEAEFDDGLALHDAFLEELRLVNFSFNGEVAAMIASAILAVAPSKKVRPLIEKCMTRTLYDGVRITDGFWKSGKGKKEDYFTVSKIVLEENLTPFTKSLYAEFISIASKLALPHA